MKLLLAFGATLLLSFASTAQESKGTFSKIENRDCSVWNQNPNPNETISWNGECVGGKTHGKGTLVFTVTEDGKTRTETLNATYVNGKREGFGEVIYSSGTRVSGEYKNDNLNGQGQIFYTDGSKFSGTFFNNLQDGRGTVTQASGDKFQGQFKGNMIIGPVTVTRSNGMILTYETNEKGEAITATTLNFKNGNKYTGQYTDYEPHGSGSMLYANGDFYEGAWDKGLNVGLGNYYWKNGDYLYASWTKGLPDSISELFYKNGKRWVANYKDGRIVSTGVMYDGYTGTNRSNGKGPSLLIKTSAGISYTGIRRATATDKKATVPDSSSQKNYILPLIQGAFYLQSENSSSALRYLNTAVSADPSKPLTYQLRGRANLASGRYAAAVEDFEMASRLSALGERAFTGPLKTSRLKAASKAAVRYAVDNTKSLMHRATVANYPEALKKLKAAKRVDPTYPELDRYIKELTELIGYQTALSTFSLPVDRCGSAPRIYGKMSRSENNTFNSTKDRWIACIEAQFLLELKAVQRFYVVTLGGTFELTPGPNRGYKNAEPGYACDCDDRARVFARRVISNRNLRVEHINALNKAIGDYNNRY